MTGAKKGRTAHFNSPSPGFICEDPPFWRLFSAPSAVYEARYPPLGDFETINENGAQIRMHMLERGPSDAEEALVLIHGASGNLRDFAFEFLDALTSHPAGVGRRVIAIDRPGLGYSDRGPGAAHRPDIQARRMRRAVAQRGVKRAVLFAHSLGAASALAWLLDAPEMVAGLVSVAGISHPWSGSAGRIYELLTTPVIGWSAAQLAGRLLRENSSIADLGPIFAPQPPVKGYRHAVGVGLALRPATLLANGRDVGWLKPLIRKQAARYGGISAPIEIIHGAEDTIVAAHVHAMRMVEDCATARLTLLEGVGHMPHHSSQAAVLSTISRVYQRIGEIG